MRSGRSWHRGLLTHAPLKRRRRCGRFLEEIESKWMKSWKLCKNSTSTRDHRSTRNIDAWFAAVVFSPAAGKATKAGLCSKRGDHLLLVALSVSTALTSGRATHGRDSRERV